MLTKTLNNGQEMPVLGLGCYKAEGEDVYCAVRWAVDAGYWHFDTATFYRNEREVGRALRECGVPREQLFVVTKQWPSDFREPDRAIERSLAELGTDYIDVYLLHWPGTDPAARYRAWEAVLNAAAQGRVRGAGVSNFLPHHLEDLIAKFSVTPVTDQVELHPMYQEREVAEFCRERGIAVTAWGPLLRGKLGEAELLSGLGEKYGRTAAQVTLRWHMQHGNIAIPKSVHRERIEENADIFDFTLSAEDMAAVDALDCGRHSSNDPDTFSGL